MVNIHVVSRYRPKGFRAKTVDDESDDDETETLKRNDEWDDFNHPRQRRSLILQELFERSKIELSKSSIQSASDGVTDIVFETATAASTKMASENQVKRDPLHLYRKVHSKGMIDF
mmetsp:Transcript_21721/g.45854  ORF Transcript_21721/g.45854 Transcript_21721/m.45854 type:complete len:116 (+) Transcript_21721:188-535(+)